MLLMHWADNETKQKKLSRKVAEVSPVGRISSPWCVGFVEEVRCLPEMEERRSDESGGGDNNELACVKWGESRVGKT